jgi:hypothetical protein
VGFIRLISARAGLLFADLRSAEHRLCTSRRPKAHKNHLRRHPGRRPFAHFEPMGMKPVRKGARDFRIRERNEVLGKMQRDNQFDPQFWASQPMINDPTPAHNAPPSLSLSLSLSSWQQLIRPSGRVPDLTRGNSQFTSIFSRPRCASLWSWRTLRLVEGRRRSRKQLQTGPCSRSD